MDNNTDFSRFRERYEGKSEEEIIHGVKFAAYHIKIALGLTYGELKRKYKELGAVCAGLIGDKRRETRSAAEQDESQITIQGGSAWA